MSPTLFVYRCFDADNNLLYVGTSTDVSRRIKQHKGVGGWASRIDVVFSAGPFPREEAKNIEAAAIRDESPRFNRRSEPVMDPKAHAQESKAWAVAKAGSARKLAAILGISPQAVSKWPDDIPRLRLYELRERKPRWFRKSKG